MTEGIKASEAAPEARLMAVEQRRFVRRAVRYLASPDGQAGAEEDERWQEVSRLRPEFHGCVIIWVACEGCFRAYRRLPGARRDTALSAPTSAETTDLISRAEQAARPARRHRGTRWTRVCPALAGIAARMQAIAEGLAAAGWDATCSAPAGALDITADLGPPGGKPVEVRGRRLVRGDPLPESPRCRTLAAVPTH